MIRKICKAIDLIAGWAAGNAFLVVVLCRPPPAPLPKPGQKAGQICPRPHALNLIVHVENDRGVSCRQGAWGRTCNVVVKSCEIRQKVKIKIYN